MNEIILACSSFFYNIYYCLCYYRTEHIYFFYNIYYYLCYYRTCITHTYYGLNFINRLYDTRGCRQYILRNARARTHPCAHTARATQFQWRCVYILVSSLCPAENYVVTCGQSVVLLSHLPPRIHPIRTAGSPLTTGVHQSVTST